MANMPAHYIPRKDLPSNVRKSIAQKRFQTPRWMNHPDTMKRILGVYADYQVHMSYPQLMDKYHVSLSQIKTDIRRAREMTVYIFAEDLDSILMEQIERHRAVVRTAQSEIEHLQAGHEMLRSKAVAELLKVISGEEVIIEKLLQMYNSQSSRELQQMPKIPGKGDAQQPEGDVIIDVTGTVVRIEAPSDDFEDGILDLET